MKFILTKQDIRDYVRKWGEERRGIGMGDFADDQPELTKNGQYDRVRIEAEKFFTKN